MQQHLTQPQGCSNSNWSFSPHALRENCRKDHLEVSSTSISTATNGIFPPAASRSDNPLICPYRSSSSSSSPSSMATHTPIHPFSPLQNQTQYNVPNVPQSRYARTSALSPSTSTSLFTCMWGGCRAQFPSLAELVGHVNLSHLRFPMDTDVSTNRGANLTDAQTQMPIQVNDATRLPCLWGDCTEFLLPEQLTGTSSNSTEDIMLSSLASHLFQDHLGLQHSSGDIPNDGRDVERLLAEMLISRHQSQNQENGAFQESHNGQNAPDIGSVVVSGDTKPIYKAIADTATHPFIQDTGIVTTSSSQTPTAIGSPATSSTEIEGHTCLWEFCGASFETCDDLMSHMSAVHVGSGKPQYDCYWEGCMRNGEKGFSSRQKICRHLQVCLSNPITELC